MTATLLSQSASVLMMTQMMAMFDNYDDIVDDDNAMFENDDEHSYSLESECATFYHDDNAMFDAPLLMMT